jgi:FkbM family methyltransferase
MLREIVEKLSRRVVLKRRLPEEFGAAPIYVTPDSALRFWSQNLSKADPTLFKVAKEIVKGGSVVWDIGANVGLFTFAAASLSGKAGKVLAVEPDTFLVDLLRRSNRSFLRASRIGAQVDVLPVAVSSRVGIEKLNIAARGRSANFLDGGGSSQTGGIRESQTVITVTLDWLFANHSSPDVLKIDVEGIEARVLRGAGKVLRDVRPIILLEVCEYAAKEITEILEANNYELYDADADLKKRIPIARATWNTLAFPK